MSQETQAKEPHRKKQDSINLSLARTEDFSYESIIKILILRITVTGKIAQWVKGLAVKCEILS